MLKMYTVNFKNLEKSKLNRKWKRIKVETKLMKYKKKHTTQRKNNKVNKTKSYFFKMKYIYILYIYNNSLSPRKFYPRNARLV